MCSVTATSSYKITESQFKNMLTSFLPKDLIAFLHIIFPSHCVTRQLLDYTATYSLFLHRQGIASRRYACHSQLLAL